MRHVFSRKIPPLEEILLVESGPREVAEKFLRHLYDIQRSRRVDIVTCYGSAPAGFDPERGTCYSIHDPAYAGRRAQLIRQLSKGNSYSVVSVLCTGSPVMNRWKWAIASRTPAKTLIVNENADFFFLDWHHRHIVKMLVSARIGMEGGLHIGLLAEILLVPFTVTYLVLCATAIQLRRALR
jgi:hypothetical protein